MKTASKRPTPTFPLVYALINDEGIAKDDQDYLHIGDREELENALDEMPHRDAKLLRLVKMRVELA